MHQIRNSNVVLSLMAGRFKCAMSPFTVQFNPVTAEDNGKKAEQPRFRKNSFERSAPIQTRGLITFGVHSWHKNMRWFSKRVNVPSARGRCCPHRKQLMVDILAES